MIEEDWKLENWRRILLSDHLDTYRFYKDPHFVSNTFFPSEHMTVTGDMTDRRGGSQVTTLRANKQAASRRQSSKSKATQNIKPWVNNREISEWYKFLPNHRDLFNSSSPMSWIFTIHFNHSKTRTNDWKRLLNRLAAKN